MNICIRCGATESKSWHQKLFGEERSSTHIYCYLCYMNDYHSKHNTLEKREAARQRTRIYYRDTPSWKVKEKERRGGLNQRFSTGKKRARKIEQPWTLTKEQYAAIISMPCYYCYNKLGQPVMVGVGIDRLDNNFG